jgi:uncharacterized membrane protein
MNGNGYDLRDNFSADRRGATVVQELQKLRRQDLWLLMVWVAIGLGLRFANLTLKPMWGDEWATLAFSLGHGFRGSPFDQLFPLTTFLEPLRFEAGRSLAAVTTSLLTESNHPPLYFWLTRLWLGLWSQDGQYVSIWVGRSLSALLGTVLIPVGFGLGWYCWQERWTAHVTALAIALSPFAVYLSQEARHYSFVLLWICLSLGCLVAIARAIKQGRSPSLPLLGGWLIVNSIGVVSHYFMILHIWAEGLVLLWLYLGQVQMAVSQVTAQGFARMSLLFKKSVLPLIQAPWRRVMFTLGANAVMILTILRAWSRNDDSKITSWLAKEYGWNWELFDPLGRLLLWLWGMLFSFPIEADSLVIVILSAIALLGLIIWLTPQWFKALKLLANHLETRLLLVLIAGNLLTFLVTTYAFQRDLFVAPRYQFIYFPAVILLLAAILRHFWQQQKKRTVIGILALMLLSSLWVNLDAVYRKPENTRAIAQLIAANSSSYPIVITTRDWRSSEVRSLLGIAWEIQQQQLPIQPDFFIINHDSLNPHPLVQQSLDKYQQPFELWMVSTPIRPPEEKCDRLPEPTQKIQGLYYKKYLCHLPTTSP